MKDFEKLIAAFEALPKQAAPSPTFMQIAGYPHYENVCSNILKFFFDTTEAHQLGNLFLRSLLECWAKNKSDELKLLSKHYTKTAEVRREDTLDDKRRIDLIIDAGDLVITIENKINHWLANDLAAYKNHTLKSFPESKYKVFLVLGIRREPNVSNDFESITYAEFFAKIKENIGEYLIRGDNRYIAFLLDFMESIEKHYMGNAADEANLDFFQDNWSKIDELHDLYKNQIKSIYYKIQELSSSLKQRPETVKKWIYEKYTLVHDFELHGCKVAVDCFIWFKEVKFKVFARNGDEESFELAKMIVASIGGPWIHHHEFTGYEMSYSKTYFSQVDTGTLAKRLDEILDKIQFFHPPMKQASEVNSYESSPEANVQ